MKRFFFLFLLAALPAISSTITFMNSMPALFQALEFSAHNTTLTARAGQIGVMVDGNIPVLMYCADPLVWLQPGPTPVTGVGPEAFPNGGRLAWLYNVYAPAVTTSLQAAALQLAIWEIIIDNNNDNLNAGLLKKTANTSSNVVILATTMLAASAGQSGTGVTFWAPNQGSSYSQTLLSGGAQAAEPSGALLLGAGLMALGAMRRKKK